METEHLHRLIDEKKWTLLLHELDLAISNNENFEMDNQIISTFEKIDKIFREDNAQKYYYDLWKIAYRVGKVKLAKNYAEFILDHLVEYKRVPALRQLIAELESTGLLKANKKFHFLHLIQGKNSDASLEDSYSFEFHPEMWKESKIALKDFLLTEMSWEVSHWKLAYEYVLKFHYDKDIFLLLAEKAMDLKKENHKKKFITYLKSHKVNVTHLENTSSKMPRERKEIYNADYDQLAMDVMSGSLEPSIVEQKKILVSINNLDDDELLKKGKDMIIAFGLLGMDQVVVNLCERLLPLLDDTPSKISIQFMLVQSLYNSGEYYKATDLVDDIFSEEPLLLDEMVAFDYVKAESFLKLKKYKQAKEIFLKIKKRNPHYRLVGERLKNLEEIK